MDSPTEPTVSSRKGIVIGRVLTTIVVAFMLFDGVSHLIVVPPVADAFNRLGVPVGFAVGLGVTELVCLVLYAIPATGVLGAILLTGYLGGAVAMQLRIGAPLLSTTLFPVYVGILVWGGLHLRDRRVRAIIPVKRRD